MLYTKEKIIRAITEDHIFMARITYKDQSALLARYILYGPCWLITTHYIGIAPVQGSDLVWLIYANEE